MPLIICHNQFTQIIGFEASEQMKLINLHEYNFERTYSIKTEEFSDAFKDELGTLPGEQTLKIKDGAQPSVMANRRVPVALKPALKEELTRLAEMKVIEPVEEPTECVSQAVITKKKSGSGVRLCIDPQELSKALLGEHYIIPIFEDTLHELSNSKLFSKVDLASGYWHIKLDEYSSKLTTFQTCIERFKWLRLPFSLSVSAEILQRKLFCALNDLHGVRCIADDIIIHGKDEAEHDTKMNRILDRCQQQGIKLNRDKCELKMKSVSFMGHIINEKGIEMDHIKVKAVNEFPTPQNVSQLKSFLGLLNFFSKFIPKQSDILHPLNNLLKNDVPWMWSKAQQEAFDNTKKQLREYSMLAFYDPKKNLLVENDASEYGLGSVLMQDLKPIAIASRTLSQSENNYAQIGKEMLAILFGLEKCHHYVYGRNIKISTDHKLLVSIIKKSLSKAPKRLQSMLLKTQGYTFDLCFKPGKTLTVADALSRAPLSEKVSDSIATVCSITNYEDIPLKKERFKQIRAETEQINTKFFAKVVLAPYVDIEAV